MRRRTPATTIAAAVLALAAAPAAAPAQTIEESLAAFGPENGALYIAPLTRGLGADLATGLFQGAMTLDVLRFELGVTAAGAPLSESTHGRFQPVLPSSIAVPELGGAVFSNPYAVGGDGTSATVVGEGEGAVLSPRGEFRTALLGAGENPDDFAIVFPDGFDVPVAPHAALHGALGLPAGFQVTVRWLPSFTPDDDLGEIDGFGFAAQAEVTRWFRAPEFLHLAVAGGRQEFNVGRYLDLEVWQFAALGSATFGPLELWTALRGGDGRADVEWDATGPGGTVVEIRVRDEEIDASGVTLGTSLRLGPMRLSGAWSPGDFDTFSAGLAAGMF
ncbi:MAG: DUF6588 family protein [Gemmatimonadota bacterium]|nr:DUF6588 family protein [Gemmatimonadota bacterium]